ncbi:unnamed protein product [Symbiodinium necroappetens]|uniref:Uncharacterized protein n=1 Tax=Symbiodinium necroappetens TaxID=1628268 RepID=A0A812KRK3_9DINO|nr:unnamed protein product [Symbiodinium necroappetens]
MTSGDGMQPWTNRHLAFFVQYLLAAFAQSLPLSAMGLILNVDLDGRAHPEEVNAFYANALLAPALIRPLLGALSDGVRRCNCGRRPVLVLLQVIWALGLVQASVSRTRWGYFVAYTAVALCTGAAEAVLDGVSVELMRKTGRSATEVQAKSFSFKTAGSLAAFAASPLMLKVFSSHYMAVRVCALVPLATAIATLTTFPAFELPGRVGAGTNAHPGASSGQRQLCRLVPRGAWFGAIFLFVRGAMPTESDTFSGFVSTKVSGVWVSIIFACSNLGSLLALVSFQALPQCRRRLVPTIVATAILSAFVGAAVQCLLAAASPSMPWMYALGAAAVGAVDSLSFLPNLAICAQCAPKDFEAAGFALLSLILDLGDQASARMASFIVQAFDLGSAEDRSWARLPLFVALCRCAMLLPLPLCALLRGIQPVDDAQADQNCQLETTVNVSGNLDRDAAG